MKFITLPSLLLSGPPQCRVGMEHFDENLLIEDIQGFSSPLREVTKLYKHNKDGVAHELRLFLVFVRLRGKDKMVVIRHESVGAANETYEKLKDL